MQFYIKMHKISISSLWICCASSITFVAIIIIQTKALMGEVMREAAFSMAEVKFAMGEINSLVIQNVAKAQIKVRTKRDNVAGNMIILHVMTY